MKSRTINSIVQPKLTCLRCCVILACICQPALASETNAAQNPASDVEFVLEGFEDSAKNHSDGNSVDETLKLFDDTEALHSDTSNLQTSALLQQSLFDTKSLVQLSAVYNYAHEKPFPGTTDHRGLSRSRFKFQSEVNADLSSHWKSLVSFFAYFDASYELNDREQYTPQLLDSFESEAEFLDTYIEGKLTVNSDLKIGRQIIAWGNSENVRVVDVLNPLDLRELGMTDIADLRLPVTAAKYDYYYGDWNFSAIAIPEIRFNRLPPLGSDYYPGMQPAAPEQDIVDGGSNTEYALALKGIFQGWDLSLHWAEYYDDSAHHELIGGSILRSHSRLQMFGVSGNGISGNWLVKSELAKVSGLEFSEDPGEQYSRIDLLIGFEYSGIRDSVLTLESAIRRIDNFRPTLTTGADATERDSYQTVIRYTSSFMNDKLDLVAVGSFYGREAKNGYLYRFSADYELITSLTITFGIVTYHSGQDPFFQQIADNDRLFMDLTYSF